MLQGNTEVYFHGGSEVCPFLFGILLKQMQTSKNNNRP